MASTLRHTWTLGEWLQWLESLHPKKIDLSLERIHQVLATLSLREPPYQVISIGGTNGKGSCVAMLESIYREAGYRVGAFTSPHLWRFNERIRLNGTDATDEVLIELFNAIEDARAGVSLSYFEYSTVAALLYFAREQVDVALLEVGLGGRLDAVNAVDAEASLIVSVGVDHQEWLGDTRDAIGREKAGIARRGRPAIVADRAPPQTVIDELTRLGAQLRLIGRDFDSDIGSSPAGWGYRGWGLRSPDLPRPSIRGAQQLDNATACLAVVEALASSLPVGAAAIYRGIQGARIRGRMEIRELHGVEWIFDVAHNPAAVSALAVELARLPTPARTLAVVAIMADKDIDGILEPLVGVVDEWIVTQANSPRSASPETLMALLQQRGVVGAISQPDVIEACGAARVSARPGDRVLVFGSFYIVGPAISALGLYCAPSQPGDVSARWTAD